LPLCSQHTIGGPGNPRRRCARRSKGSCLTASTGTPTET